VLSIAPRGTAIAAGVLALLASCGAPEAPEEALPRLVLQPSDLPEGFVQFDWGPVGRDEALPGLAEATNDRRGGWKARYRQPGGEAAPGPLVVTSFAETFGSDDAAAEHLDTSREALRTEAQAASGRLVSIAGLGEEATGSTYVQQALEPVRYFTIAWRDGNVVASISVNGVDLTLDDALALARKQDRRIRAVV
jgi:hypothetical protein